ncbi:MAG: barstar family protein [Cellvibrio sp.]|nr:barstar family protein [Cellvibrio sp.]
MKLYVIDCYAVKTEAEFWAEYLSTVKPQGTEYFGRNLDAFWDALSAGGPGYPNHEGKCELRFINTDPVKLLRNGAFYKKLQEIEQDLRIEVNSDVAIMLG